MATQDYTLRLDEVSPTLSYLGKTFPGGAETDPVWQIKRLETVGTVLAITYPAGENNFNQVWANRTTYTYQ